MDPRQQNHDYGGNVSQQSGVNYAFNGGQNDSFSSFINTDNDSAFDSSWNTQTFPNHQQPVNGFDQSDNVWQRNPYQPNNLTAAPSYGAQTREFDQSFSRSPAPFEYPGYLANSNQTFAPSEYERSLKYGSLTLSNNPQYDYTGHSQHNTISPQALQSYPESYLPQRPAQNKQYGQPTTFHESLTNGVTPTTAQEWLGFSSNSPDSIVAKGMRIKPTTGFEKATKSTRFDGFTFVGSGILNCSTTKAAVPKYRQKRSVKELRSLLQYEKGIDLWHRDREPVLKKLKKIESQLAGPRSVGQNQSRSGSVAESASPSESSDSDSEEDSDYASESEVEIEPEEPSPLPPQRPLDPNKAVEYDIIKAVWAKKGVGLSSTVIRTALGECWDIFKGIRDKWKQKSTSLQQAVEKKDQANIKAYERRTQEQRRLLESCIGLTLKHGHPDIIAKLGENPSFILIFYQFLADRFKDSEYAGDFIASILELMTRCATIDQALLEKTKMDKVLPRLVKRGDERGKTLAQKTLDNAVAASQLKESGPKSIKAEQANGASIKKEQPSISDGKAIKKDQVEAKKPLIASNKAPNAPSAVKSARTSENRPPSTRVESKGQTKPPGVDSSGPKTKTNVVPAKPSGFFSSLKSASKKPKAEDAKKRQVNDNPDGFFYMLTSGSAVSEMKSETPIEPAKPAFSFAATMATLNAQKEAPPVKHEENRKSETPEEKRKRLRKEERRKLRVSFKGDEDLVQVREFVHDPEEEIGHEDSQVRDVGDSRGEGQMLKMHKDLDLDDDEDYEPPEEIVEPEWRTPHPTDFGDVDEDEQLKNYTNRGGRKEIESDERAQQEQRELTTLMVVYANPSDIPSSPREPTEQDSDEYRPEDTFGTPGDGEEGWFKIRQAEAEQRLGGNNQRAVPQTQPVDIHNLLRIINNTPKPLQPQPAALQPIPNALESIFATLAQQNQQQQQPPQMQAVQQQAPQLDLAALLGSTQKPSPAQASYGTPQPPAPSAANLQAILAQFGTQPAPQAPQMQGYTYPYQNDNERKRQYDNDEGDNSRKKKKYHGPPRLPCKFFQEGKCRKGDECTYLHEM